MGRRNDNQEKRDQRRLVIRHIAATAAGALAGGVLGYFGQCAGGG